MSKSRNAQLEDWAERQAVDAWDARQELRWQALQRDIDRLESERTVTEAERDLMSQQEQRPQPFWRQHVAPPAEPETGRGSEITDEQLRAMSLDDYAKVRHMFMAGAR